MIITSLSNSFIFVLGRVAQLVEQLTFNQWVTGSNPVALTTFPHLDSGNKYNDLANNLLKTLPNFKHPYLKRTYLVLRAYLKIRSKIPPKSIKVSCKCLVDFSQGLQVITLSVTGYALECDRLLSKKCLVKFKFYFKVCKTI